MDRDATERRADSQRAYQDDPEFVDRNYQVPSLADLLSAAGVVGVARFIELPSFEPERLFTFVYHPKVIAVSAVIGASSLWWSMSEGERFDPTRALRRSAVCEPWARICPPLLRSWAALRAASVSAGDCSTDTMLDGIGYRHRLADHEFRSDTEWSNPKLPEHAPQVALIKGYVQLLRGVELYPK